MRKAALARSGLPRSVRPLAALLVVGSSLLACAKRPPEVPAGSATPRSSTQADRESVSVTIYNSNFGLVRETRRVKLDEGKVALAFADVSAHIQPETVHLKSLDGNNLLTVLEQNYRYDLLTPDKLLEKYVGKKIKVARYHEKLGTEEIVEADVLAVEGGPVFRINGEIVTGQPGRLIFAEIPSNLLSRPTLVWLLASARPEQRLEVSYLTGQMRWRADYVLVLAEDDKRADLSGWVTLENRSGTSYDGAELKLVAGDVQRVVPPAPAPVPEEEGYAYEYAEAAAPPPFAEEQLFEYHLYTLSRKTDLKDNEQKQVNLLEASSIPVEKKLIVRGQNYWYTTRAGTVLEKQKVSAYLEFENSEKNQLGMPLPKGTIRVYKASRGGAQEFVGEDSIDHTPRDEKVLIKLGESFDVVVDQRQTEYRALSSCSSESAWEIALRNHKDQAETVEVEQPVSGDYEILSSSHKATKKDAHTFTFQVKVDARGETKITYRVRNTYC
jgi:hypothetical protein